MSELTVQVPVSLIRRTVDALAFEGIDVPELAALLEQPAPTAERLPPGPVSNGHRWPCTRFYTASTERDKCTCGGVANPPHIEDMAPGTRFVGDVWHGSRTFMVTIDSVVAAESGLSYFPDDIDPSTIRDVTPPEDAA